MRDFLSQNALPVVLCLSLACWLGIFLYLLRLDRMITRLEHKNSPGTHA